jgi:hypothetical protein
VKTLVVFSSVLGLDARKIPQAFVKTLAMALWDHRNIIALHHQL